MDSEWLTWTPTVMAQRIATTNAQRMLEKPPLAPVGVVRQTRTRMVMARQSAKTNAPKTRQRPSLANVGVENWRQTQMGIAITAIG